MNQRRPRFGSFGSAALRVPLIVLACAAAPLVCRVGSGFSWAMVLPLAAAFILVYLLMQLLPASRASALQSEVLRTLALVIIASGAAFAGYQLYPRLFVAPSSVLMVAALLVMVTLLSVRALSEISIRPNLRGRRIGDRTLIVGSGDAAATFIQIVRENPAFPFEIVGCVDDEKLSDDVAGKRVLGAVADLPRLINKHRIGTVIVAIPFAPAALVKRTVSLCLNAAGSEGKPAAVKILPGVMELLSDGIRAARIRSVKPEDLLPRDPVKVDLSTVAPHLENRVILVTGAGGSIGSELCRQIVGFNPKTLLLLGHGENSLFAIDEELRLKFGFLQTKIILADVADAARIRSVFSEFRPHVVFHAAAHKHVPIVESNVCEAVRNNILGTHVVALAAAAAGAAKFVLLSTDKAVNPTSVMGVTKRLAEIISQSFVNQTGTEFVTVRFGNVIESRGSVIPVFKRQIEMGGPVTITHRDMQRYFMTIPEAVSLVLQAMAIGRDGQVLVLDMGQPVNILKLAETLITLSGLTPHRDIPIVETGIRPGEKLFEEILTSHEGLSTTSHERLFIARQERVAYDTLALGLSTLERSVRTGERDVIIDVLRNFVPSFTPGAHLCDRQSVDEFDGAALRLTTNGSTNGASHNGHAASAADADGYQVAPVVADGARQLDGAGRRPKEPIARKGSLGLKT